MTDVEVSAPPSREEEGLAEQLGRQTHVMGRRLPWFTESKGLVQKSFELLCAMSLIAVLFWACVSFFVVMRQVVGEEDSAASLHTENTSLRAEVDEWREQALLTEAENRDLADELRETRQEVCP